MIYFPSLWQLFWLLMGVHWGCDVFTTSSSSPSPSRRFVLANGSNRHDIDPKESDIKSITSLYPIQQDHVGPNNDENSRVTLNDDNLLLPSSFPSSSPSLESTSSEPTVALFFESPSAPSLRDGGESNDVVVPTPLVLSTNTTDDEETAPSTTTPQPIIPIVSPAVTAPSTTTTKTIQPTVQPTAVTTIPSSPNAITSSMPTTPSVIPIPPSNSHENITLIPTRTDNPNSTETATPSRPTTEVPSTSATLLSSNSTSTTIELDDDDRDDDHKTNQTDTSNELNNHTITDDDTSFPEAPVAAPSTSDFASPVAIDLEPSRSPILSQPDNDTNNNSMNTTNPKLDGSGTTTIIPTNAETSTTAPSPSISMSLSPSWLLSTLPSLSPTTRAPSLSPTTLVPTTEAFAGTQTTLPSSTLKISDSTVSTPTLVPSLCQLEDTDEDGVYGTLDDGNFRFQYYYELETNSTANPSSEVLPALERAFISTILPVVLLEASLCGGTAATATIVTGPNNTTATTSRSAGSQNSAKEESASDSQRRVQEEEEVDSFATGVSAAPPDAVLEGVPCRTTTATPCFVVQGEMTVYFDVTRIIDFELGNRVLQQLQETMDAGSYESQSVHPDIVRVSYIEELGGIPEQNDDDGGHVSAIGGGDTNDTIIYGVVLGITACMLCIACTLWRIGREDEDEPVHRGRFAV